MDAVANGMVRSFYFRIQLLPVRNLILIGMIIMIGMVFNEFSFLQMLYGALHKKIALQIVHFVTLFMDVVMVMSNNTIAEWR